MHHQLRAAIYALAYICAALALLLVIAFYQIYTMKNHLTVVPCGYHETPYHCQMRLGSMYEVIYNPRTGTVQGEYNP